MSELTSGQAVTDFYSRRVNGYALADEEHRYFDMPLVSHIEGNLWTGGCVDRVRLPDDFRRVISLYPWEKYDLGPSTIRVEWEMYDAAGMPDLNEVRHAAEAVVSALHSGKTLVHCQAGLNRSGLVAAVALVRMGRTPREAIDLLRAKRGPVVLCNPTFERWLLAWRWRDNWED